VTRFAQKKKRGTKYSRAESKQGGIGSAENTEGLQTLREVFITTHNL
jgi:hypothetical protein